MTRLESFSDVLKAVDTLYSNNIGTHDVTCSKMLTWPRNLIWNNWHLFTSNSSLIKWSSELIANLIRHNDWKDDWDENIYRLRCLHNNDSQWICHSSVSRQSCSTPNANQIFPVAFLLFICKFCCMSYSIKLWNIKVDISNSAAYNHSW